MYSASTTTGRPQGDAAPDYRAIADGLGLTLGVDSEGRDDRFVQHAAAFLLPTRETQAARVACFRRLVPLFMSHAPCGINAVIERAAMHGFALAFIDEMCSSLEGHCEPCGDADDGGSTAATVPSLGVLCVAKKSMPGPQGSVSFIALTNKDSNVHYEWNGCRKLCFQTPSGADTAAAAAAAAAADATPRDAEKWGAEYEVVPVNGPSETPGSKTLDQVVMSVIACFKQNSCRYAEDVTEFAELFPDIPLWQST